MEGGTSVVKTGVGLENEASGGFSGVLGHYLTARDKLSPEEKPARLSVIRDELVKLFEEHAEDIFGLDEDPETSVSLALAMVSIAGVEGAINAMRIDSESKQKSEGRAWLNWLRGRRRQDGKTAEKQGDGKRFDSGVLEKAWKQLPDKFIRTVSGVRVGRDAAERVKEVQSEVDKFLKDSDMSEEDKWLWRAVAADLGFRHVRKDSDRQNDKGEEIGYANLGKQLQAWKEDGWRPEEVLQLIRAVGNPGMAAKAIASGVYKPDMRIGAPGGYRPVSPFPGADLAGKPISVEKPQEELWEEAREVRRAYLRQSLRARGESRGFSDDLPVEVRNYLISMGLISKSPEEAHREFVGGERRDQIIAKLKEELEAVVPNDPRTLKRWGLREDRRQELIDKWVRGALGGAGSPSGVNGRPWGPGVRMG